MSNIKATRIGSRVQSLREEADLTVEQAAQSLPIEASTLGSIERGEIMTPSIPVIEAMAELYNVSVGSLMDLLSEGAMPLENVAVNKNAANGVGKSAAVGNAGIFDKMKSYFQSISLWDVLGEETIVTPIIKLTKRANITEGGKVGGNLILFTSPTDTDLDNEFFDASTDYGVKSGDIVPIDFHHSGNPLVKNIPIGHAPLTFTDSALAIKGGQLWIDDFDDEEFIKYVMNQREEYRALLERYGYKRVRSFIASVAKTVHTLAEAGELGWSSEAGGIPERKYQNGIARLNRWIVEKATLTPTPAEWRNDALTKSINEAVIELSAETLENEVTSMSQIDDNAPVTDELTDTGQNTEGTQTPQFVTSEDLAEVVKEMTLKIMSELPAAIDAALAPMSAKIEKMAGFIDVAEEEESLLKTAPDATRKRAVSARAAALKEIRALSFARFTNGTPVGGEGVKSVKSSKLNSKDGLSTNPRKAALQALAMRGKQ